MGAIDAPHRVPQFVLETVRYTSIPYPGLRSARPETDGANGSDELWIQSCRQMEHAVSASLCGDTIEMGAILAIDLL